MIRDFFVLIKSRILLYSLLTLTFGFWVGSGGVFKQPLGWVLLGAFFVFSASAAFNHLFEADADAKMARTSGRPVASQRLSKVMAFIFALLCLILGIFVLSFKAGLFESTFILFTFIMYDYIYTPLKRMTSWNTFVGAIPGAFPPLCGWIAATGTLNLHAFILFLFFFWWQLPHFFAISWMYKEDYAQAGFEMLSKHDVTGSKTVRALWIHTVLLVLSSLAWLLFFNLGVLYGIGALLSGVVFFYYIRLFSQDRSFIRAKKLMLWSLLYLFIVMSCAVLDLLF